jgi:thiol-disulfide isomerase/thioredoxin
VKHLLTTAVLTLAALIFAGCESSFDLETAPEPAPIVVPEPAPQPAPVERRQILAFTAKWCGACQADKPELATLDSEIEIIRIDADQRPDLVQQYGVTALPTYIVMRDGREVERDCSLSKIIKVLKFWRWLRSK